MHGTLNVSKNTSADFWQGFEYRIQNAALSSTPDVVRDFRDIKITLSVDGFPNTFHILPIRHNTLKIGYFNVKNLCSYPCRYMFEDVKGRRCQTSDHQLVMLGSSNQRGNCTAWCIEMQIQTFITPLPLSIHTG